MNKEELLINLNITRRYATTIEFINALDNICFYIGELQGTIKGLNIQLEDYKLTPEKLKAMIKEI